MTSQCARLGKSGGPLSQVSVSGSGCRGCSATNASNGSLTSGHHDVSCPAFGCGRYTRSTPPFFSCSTYGSTTLVGYSGSRPPLTTNSGLFTQVVRKEIAVGLGHLVPEDHDETVERQEARERRRVPHARCSTRRCRRRRRRTARRGSRRRCRSASPDRGSRAGSSTWRPLHHGASRQAYGMT